MAATTLVLETALRVGRYRPAGECRSARLVDYVGHTLLDCYPSNPRGYFDIDLRTPAHRERYRHLAAARRFEAVARRAPYAVLSRYTAAGFRDSPLGPRTKGVRRVLLVGDSFTEGQGVKESDTYARILEAGLNATGTTRWEVRNCGGRGADFPRLHETFTEVIPHGADVVVYAMVLNDAVQSRRFASGRGYLDDWMMIHGRTSVSGEERTAAGSRLWGLVRERLQNRRVSIESTRFYRDLYAEPNREGWDETQRLIRAMDQHTRAQQGRFVVALWPWLVDLEYGYPFEAAHETIRRFCEGAGITFHDLRPSLATRPAEALWVHPVDWHPNDVAHRLVGDALVPVIRSLSGAESDPTSRHEDDIPLQSPDRRAPMIRQDGRSLTDQNHAGVQVAR